MESAAELFSLLETGGTVALLVVVVFGAWKEWWVPGPAHKRRVTELTQERNEWKDMALRGVNATEKAVDLARDAPDVV